MTDPENEQSCPVPDPTIVDPFPRNGQCAPDGFTNNQRPGQPEAFTTGQEMKITDSVEGEGNFIRRLQTEKEKQRGKSSGCACIADVFQSASEGPWGRRGVFLRIAGIFRTP